MPNTFPMEIDIDKLVISQSMAVDESDGRLVAKYALKMDAKARCSLLPDCACQLKIYEVSKQGKAGASTGLGFVAQAEQGLSITLFATREFLSGLVDLVPGCVLANKGQLSMHLQLRGDVKDNQIQGKLNITAADYTVVNSLG